MDPDLALVQYWDTEEIPDYVADEIATFAELNPDFRHRVFSRAAAEQFIADHLTPREVAAFRSCAVPAMQADYFRCCAGLVLEGVYSDADFRCIAPVAPLVPAKGRIRLFQGPRGGIINSIFAFRSPGHDFLQLALEIATVNIERRFPDTVYFATGPPILTGLLALYASGSRDGSIPPRGGPLLQEAVRAYWGVIGDADRVTAAFREVELRPTEEYRRHARVEGKMPYKHSDSDWRRYKGEIFS